jgi:hypothetical protein
MVPTETQAEKIRPGKGLEIIPGEFAEYTNILYKDNKKIKQLKSTIMIAIGSKDGLIRVRVVYVKGEKVVGNSMISYDPSKTRQKKGKLLGKKNKKIKIEGRLYKCTQEKRKYKDTIGTFLACPGFPFEGYYRVRWDSPEGEYLITQLVSSIELGPNRKKNMEKNLNRLKRLVSGKEKVEKTK